MLIKTHYKRRQRGVSLLEVLIALLVIAVGVLGLTKMQALSISNTQVSGSRGLVALQASSLAAFLHGNKGYWQDGVGSTLCTGTTCTFSGLSSTVLGTAPALSSCQGITSATACTPAQIAALDITTWMNNINRQVPSYTGIITCSGTPTTCTIQINWYEKAAGMNIATADQAATTSATQQAYYLYVQP